jgi:hypothetical protein
MVSTKNVLRRSAYIFDRLTKSMVKRLITTVAVVAGVLLPGCNGDSNPNDAPGVGVENGSVCGTWIMTRMTYEVGTATYTVVASESQQLTLTLNPDLTYHQRQVSSSSGVNVTTEEEGTYTISGSALNQISRTGIQTSGSYSLTDTVMILTCIKIAQGQTYTTVYQFRRG